MLLQIAQLVLSIVGGATGSRGVALALAIVGGIAALGGGGGGQDGGLGGGGGGIGGQGGNGGLGGLGGIGQIGGLIGGSGGGGQNGRVVPGQLGGAPVRATRGERVGFIRQDADDLP